VLRVQVVDLTGRPLSLAPNGGAHFEAVAAFRRALMSYSAIPAALDMGEESGHWVSDRALPSGIGEPRDPGAGAVPDPVVVLVQDLVPLDGDAGIGEPAHRAGHVAHRPAEDRVAGRAQLGHWSIP
jgi:hypothetical protein